MITYSNVTQYIFKTGVCGLLKEHIWPLWQRKDSHKFFDTHPIERWHLCFLFWVWLGSVTTLINKIWQKSCYVSFQVLALRYWRFLLSVLNYSHLQNSPWGTHLLWLLWESEATWLRPCLGALLAAIAELRSDNKNQLSAMRMSHLGGSPFEPFHDCFLSCYLTANFMGHST